MLTLRTTELSGRTLASQQGRKLFREPVNRPMPASLLLLLIDSKIIGRNRLAIAVKNIELVFAGAEG